MKNSFIFSELIKKIMPEVEFGLFFAIIADLFWILKMY